MRLIKISTGRSDFSPHDCSAFIGNFPDVLGCTSKSEDAAEILRRHTGSLETRTTQLPNADTALRRQTIYREVASRKMIERSVGSVRRLKRPKKTLDSLYRFFSTSCIN